MDNHEMIRQHAARWGIGVDDGRRDLTRQIEWQSRRFACGSVWVKAAIKGRARYSRMQIILQPEKAIDPVVVSERLQAMQECVVELAVSRIRVVEHG